MSEQKEGALSEQKEGALSQRKEGALSEWNEGALKLKLCYPRKVGLPMGTEAEAGAPEGPQGRNRQGQHPQKSSQLVSLYRGKIDNAFLPENIRLKRYWLKFPGFPEIDSRISQVERRKISTRKVSALFAYRRIFQIFKYILYT